MVTAGCCCPDEANPHAGAAETLSGVGSAWRAVFDLFPATTSVVVGQALFEVRGSGRLGDFKALDLPGFRALSDREAMTATLLDWSGARRICVGLARERVTDVIQLLLSRGDMSTGITALQEELAARCLASWRTYLHHDHAFDPGKRFFHPVWGKLNDWQSVQAAEIAAEVGFLSRAKERLSELVRLTEGQSELWAERLEGLYRLRMDLRQMAEEGPKPTAPGALVAQLDRVEVAFRPREEDKAHV